MLPGGIQEDELEIIWGKGWRDNVQKLKDYSLISQKEYPNAKSKLILPPFMSNYAEAKIPLEDKIKFQSEICKYYSRICKKIFEINNK